MKPSCCVLLLALFTFGCGYGSSYNSGSGGMAAPSISALVPSSVPAGSAAFVLTVNGTNFGTDATLYWNTAARNTTYVTNKQLTVMVTASDVAMAGTITVYVRSNGQNSSNATFTVN